MSWRVIVACLPLAFGAAHLHHVLELVNRQGVSLPNALRATAFQFAYTSVFGAYACFLLLRSGNLAAPVAAHCFCNAMGFPPLGQIAQSRVLAAATVAGLAAFACLLGPATSEQWLRPHALWDALAQSI